MGLCISNNIPAGLNLGCKAQLGRAKGIFMVTNGTSVTTANANKKSTWQALLKTSLTGFYIPFSDYEPSVDDPEVQTDGNGVKRQVKQFAPSLTFYADTGFCDYQAISRVAKGGTFGFYLVQEDGTLYGWTSGADFKPFTGSFYSYTAGFAPKEAIHQNNRLDVYFSSVDEFSAASLVQPLNGWNTHLAFVDATPTGYDVTVNSFDGDDILAVVNLRCEDSVDTFLVADFEVTETSQSGVTIATVSNTAGVYTLTLSATLTSGNYLNFRLKKVASGDTSDISGTVSVEI